MFATDLGVLLVVMLAKPVWVSDNGLITGSATNGVELMTLDPCDSKRASGSLEGRKSHRSRERWVDSEWATSVNDLDGVGFATNTIPEPLPFSFLRTTDTEGLPGRTACRI